MVILIIVKNDEADPKRRCENVDNIRNQKWDLVQIRFYVCRNHPGLEATRVDKIFPLYNPMGDKNKTEILRELSFGMETRVFGIHVFKPMTDNAIPQ